MPLSPLYFFFFFFNDTATTEIYTLSLHDALPIFPRRLRAAGAPAGALPRRPAVARCRDARPGRRSNDPVATTAPDADRRLPGQRGHCRTSADAQARSDPELGRARAGIQARPPRP